VSQSELLQDERARRERAEGVQAELTGNSPRDLHPLPPVRTTPVEQVSKLVARGREVQEGWSHRGFTDRVRCLRRAAKAMLARRRALMALLEEEMGKVEAEALFNEALGPLDAVKGWARVLRVALKRRRVRLNPLSFPRKRAHVDLVPRGVIGIIAPWNFPVSGLFRSVLPALMSGNAVVLKPSDYTPRASLWFAEVLAEHLPPGLIQVVQGGSLVGEALIEAGIDACVFTGSTTSGRRVQVHCAKRGIPCSVEMGGKDPAIVFGDCDLDRTVAGITHWALCNVGQACGAIEIAYVDRSIADAFVERMRQVWQRLRVGPGHGSSTDIGPLANQRQFDVVCAQVDDARAKGATVVCGGSPLGIGFWYAPTLLDHCTESMAVVREETFGPVLAIVRVDGPREAILAANCLGYGLGASLWTGDLARGRRLAERLDYGVVSVNNHAFTGAVSALPWTGTRGSGFGVANSALALPVFLRPRTTVVDHSTKPDLYWMPYDKTLCEVGDVLADLQRNRVERAWRLPLLIRRRFQALRAFYK
jgi:acyl-CoA reductase-like NAD-dependent aldehyde dehydrogenase